MRSAVQQVRQPVIHPAANRDRECWIISLRPLSATTDRRSRKKDQFRHLARVERQFENTHIVDNLTDTGTPGFDLTRVRQNLHRLGHLPDPYRDTKYGVRPDR